MHEEGSRSICTSMIVPFPFFFHNCCDLTRNPPPAPYKKMQHTHTIGSAILP